MHAAANGSQAARTADLDHSNVAYATSMRRLALELKEIQGDVLIGLQKNAENFIFFKIVDVASFKILVKSLVFRRITNLEQVQQREFVVRRRTKMGWRTVESFRG